MIKLSLENLLNPPPQKQCWDQQQPQQSLLEMQNLRVGGKGEIKENDGGSKFNHHIL
jgi:hypothetical protein